jgi:SAM-dependent methyltransferase
MWCTKSRQHDLKALSEGLIRNVGRMGMPGNVLEIRHADAPHLQLECLRAAAHEFGVLVSLNRGNEPHPGQSVICETGRLPFQDSVFCTVLLHHVISDGLEVELDEAVRVLARDGILIILGINRMGWLYYSRRCQNGLPGIAPLKVKVRLDRLDMTMQGFAGAGLLGMQRPVFMGSGLASLGSPVADIVLLRARHRCGPEMTPLSRSNAVQSAPL